MGRDGLRDGGFAVMPPDFDELDELDEGTICCPVEGASLDELAHLVEGPNRDVFASRDVAYERRGTVRIESAGASFRGNRASGELVVEEGTVRSRSGTCVASRTDKADHRGTSVFTPRPDRKLESR